MILNYIEDDNLSLEKIVIYQIHYYKNVTSKHNVVQWLPG